MRVRIPGRVTVIALLAGSALAAAALAPVGWAAGHAPRKLTLVDRSPVTVSGTGFGVRSRVTVTLSLAGTFTRHPLTDRHGTFKISFPVTIDRCSAWTVSAAEHPGATIMLRPPKPPPECAPASAP